MKLLDIKIGQNSFLHTAFVFAISKEENNGYTTHSSSRMGCGGVLEKFLLSFLDDVEVVVVAAGFVSRAYTEKDVLRGARASQAFFSISFFILLLFCATV